MNTIQRCRYGLMIYNRKDIYQGKSFENFGEYSEEESLLYKKFIKEGNTVYDIGANIGSFTLLFSRLVGNNGGFVLALEPERHNFYTLCGQKMFVSGNAFVCYVSRRKPHETRALQSSCG